MEVKGSGKHSVNDYRRKKFFITSPWCLSKNVALVLQLFSYFKDVLFRYLDCEEGEIRNRIKTKNPYILITRIQRYQKSNSFLYASAGNTKGGSITTVDLLFDLFGLVCFANKNKNCELSYS